MCSCLYGYDFPFLTSKFSHVLCLSFYRGNSHTVYFLPSFSRPRSHSCRPRPDLHPSRPPTSSTFTVAPASPLVSDRSTCPEGRRRVGTGPETGCPVQRILLCRSLRLCKGKPSPFVCTLILILWVLLGYVYFNLFF